jgi:hypothetical protein
MVDPVGERLVARDLRQWSCSVFALNEAQTELGA